jgi:hypothetical protein
MPTTSKQLKKLSITPMCSLMTNHIPDSPLKALSKGAEPDYSGSNKP